MAKSQSNDVALRLRAIGLQPTVVQSLLSEIDGHLKHHGPEWTAERLKAYKVDFVRLLAGQEPCGGYAKRYVPVLGRFYRLPKGVMGHIFRLGIVAASKRSQRDLHRVWNALITYTRFVSPDVTWKQWKKFSTAVRKPPPSETELQSARGYVALGLRSLPQPPTYSGEPKPLITYQPREGKRRPLGKETVPERSSGIVLELDAIRKVDRYLPLPLYTPEIASVLKGTDDWRPNALFVKGPAPVDKRRRKEMFARERARKEPCLAGVIGLIQEPGFKLRAVANPYRVYQRALEPMGKALFKWLRSIPEDCCFHQDSGVFAIQEVMTMYAGKRCLHSMDLSNATDRFPLTLMTTVFSRLRVPKGALELLLRVARGKWYLPPRSSVSKAEKLVWESGLPLGLYPCFALFSLAHHALVRGICLKLGRDFCYRILGDDIVIWDDQVAEEYERVMDEIGCPIAMAKTVHSARVAEFAGRVITPWTILHGLKYGEEPNDNSFLELVKFLGPRTIRLLKPKQQQVARFVAELPQPWGFGYNPRGIPYVERLRKAEAWALSKAPKVEQIGIVQTRIVFQSFYAEEKDPGRTFAKRMAIAPDAIEQIASSPIWSEAWSSVPPEIMRPNVLHVLDLQREGVLDGLKGTWSRAELRRLLVSTDQHHPDHPFSKPLVQSLHARLLRTKQLLSAD